MAKLTLEMVGNSIRNDYRPLVIPPANRFDGRPNELCDFQNFPQVTEHHGAHFYQTRLELDPIFRQVMETPKDAARRNGSRHLTPAIGIHGTAALGVDIHDPAIFRATLKVLYDKQRASDEWKKAGLDVPFHQFFDQIDSVKGEQIASTPYEISKAEVLTEVSRNQRAERKAALKNIVQWWAVEGVLQGKECEAHGTNPKTHIPYKQAIEYYKWYSVEQGFEYQPFTEHERRGGFHPPHRNYYRNSAKNAAQREVNALERVHGGLTEILYGSPNLSQEEFEAVQFTSVANLSDCKRSIQRQINVGDNSKRYNNCRKSAEQLVDLVQKGILHGMTYPEYRTLMREVIAEARAEVKFQCTDEQFEQVKTWGAAGRDSEKEQPETQGNHQQNTVKEEPAKIGFIKPIVALLTAGFAAFSGESKQPEGANDPDKPKGNWFQRYGKDILRGLAALVAVDVVQGMLRKQEPWTVKAFQSVTGGWRGK